MRLPRINKRKTIKQTIHIHELELLEPMDPKFKKRHNILKEIKEKNILYINHLRFPSCPPLSLPNITWTSFTVHMLAQDSFFFF